MPEILEGKFYADHQDPQAIHEANKTIFLLAMSALIMFPIGHLSYILGIEIAERFIVR